jgi:hypothetical protein
VHFWKPRRKVVAVDETTRVGIFDTNAPPNEGVFGAKIPTTPV